MSNDPAVLDRPTDLAADKKGRTKLLEDTAKEQDDERKTLRENDRAQARSCPACAEGKMKRKPFGFQCDNDKCGHYEVNSNPNNRIPECQCHYCVKTRVK